MRRYYWAAKAVTQLNQILLLNIAERLQPQAEEPTPINERFFERGGLIEVASDDLYLTRPARDPRDLPALPEDHRRERPVGAHAAGALQRAPRDGQQVPQRPGQPRDLHAHADGAARHHAFAPADEPDLGAGPLPARVPQHRGPDAARPVPRLHGRPAHPDGGAQRAPLLHRRACARIPVLLAAGRGLGQALDPVRRGAVPRHRQGPRRRPFRPWARATCGASAASTRSAREDTQADRVPGRRAPGDEPDRAEAGPERPRGHQQLRPARRQRALPDRALPADHRRHPRHLAARLERLEGQAARGPVPLHAARARRPHARPGRRDRGAQARGAGAAGAPCRALRGPSGRSGTRSTSATSCATTPPRSPGMPSSCRATCRMPACRSTRMRRRSCGPGCRRSAKACRWWSTRPTCPTCSCASAATSTSPPSASWMPRCTPPATASRSTPSRSSPPSRPSTTAT